MIKNVFTMLWWNEPSVRVPKRNELVLCVSPVKYGKQALYSYDVCRYDADADAFYTAINEYDYLENVCAWASLTRDDYLIKKLREVNK